jgi:glycosyltransferase involved in cell wall biosynthesis
MPEQIAGTEMYVYSLQQQLKRMGHSGGVIIPFFKQQNKSEYEFNGIRVFGYPQDFNSIDKVIKGLEPPSGLHEFGRLLDKIQPDLLHFHELSGSNGITIFHLKMAHERKIPVILTMHLVGYVCAAGTLIEHDRVECNGIIEINRCTNCSFSHQLSSPPLIRIYTHLSNMFRKAGVPLYEKKGKIAGLLGRAERIQLHKNRLHLIADYCSSIVTLNNWFYKMLVNNGIDPQKISVIPQGLSFSVPTDDKTIDLSQSGIPLRLVFVGRIYPSKGLHLLLSALVNLNPESFRLDIYGASNDNTYLNKCQQIVGKNLSIRFCSIIPPGQTVAYLKNYHLLVLPSVVTEMAPLVIQEAFAAHIPVIASNVYGNADQINHGVNGLLFKFNDVEDLRIQILKCINHPDLLDEMSKNITAPRSFKDLASDYLALYKSILN